MKLELSNLRFRLSLSPGLLFAHALSAFVAGLLAAGLLWIDFPAFSQSRYPITAFYRCTRDVAIIDAFTLMADSPPGRASLDLIVQKPMRVIFKDMRTMGKAFKNYDALSWISNQGEHVIFINDKHRIAPPEALAALISHEAMHADAFNSINEEVAGWRSEAAVWTQMKAKNTALATIPEGTIPLVDRVNKIEVEQQKGTLDAFVRARPGYTGLPESSPGFGDHMVSKR